MAGQWATAHNGRLSSGMAVEHWQQRHQLLCIFTERIDNGDMRMIKNEYTF